MNSISIYHNPKCGTSRNTLAIIRNAGIEPRVIHYLETPPSKAQLQDLIKAMGVSAREIMREKEALYTELGLDNPKWSEDERIDYMLQYPILINRPIVVSPLGTRLCRPSELVLDLLSSPQQGAFNKEDGQAVINERGERV